ncbi:DUF4868 domain-containing protein [Paenibacillus sp. MBLB2552]|uniref:DUF4868 domain-containing protein n=1 Tax=Paenibacillus mellifer TaxID=2937794 RepID=A0A9X2BNM1_9BACL|nr:Kiwa anti-phage protein KwaB-like domain-containing protein [Paenibacillus mellifer]MCK8487024.1 DUF4868 domain-containing protein [Paenibacillus mellifer]
MDINHNDNLIYKLSNMSDEQLKDVDLSFHLVRLQKEADQLYQSAEIQLAPDVITWLKKNVVKSLNGLKQADETENKVFLVGDYNHEISINDQIAKFTVNEEYKELSDKVGKLTTSLSNPDPEYPEKDTKFQIVKLTFNNETAYFCYYRSIKKNSMKASSKKILVYKNASQYEFVDDTMIDLGGSIDFFIVNNYIYIVSAQRFENAFVYSDHMIERRDQNIEQIISMPFFDSEASNSKMFQESCKKYAYSRTLANINSETMAAVQKNFDARCKELSQIKENEPKDQTAKERYIAKYGILWGLFEYIDLKNRKVIFTEDASPKPLIHFFANKIVKSFVTEDYKVAVAYE